MMTAAELLCKLLEFPSDQPVEIETLDGTRLNIVGVDKIGHGVLLLTSDDVRSRQDGDDLFDSAFNVVKAYHDVRGQMVPTPAGFGDFCTLRDRVDEFIDMYVHEEDLK